MDWTESRDVQRFYIRMNNIRHSHVVLTITYSYQALISSVVCLFHLFMKSNQLLENFGKRTFQEYMKQKNAHQLVQS